MPSYADRIKQTVSTTGTGTYTLGSAVSGFQTFANAGFSDTDDVFYAIVMGTGWEVGRGVLGSTQTTLTRATIYASSNSNNAVDWGAGDKVLFNDLPAHRLNEMDVSIAANDAKISFDSTSSTRLANTSGTNTGDQDLSGKENTGVAQGIMDTHETTHPIPTTRDSRNQVAMGGDDNYVTDAEKTVIGNTSGTNTGDQTVISLVTSDPGTPTTGDMWVNTTDNQLKFKTSAGTITFDAWQYVAD